MTNYYNYLEESTNVVKSKHLVAKIIIIMSYLIIWAGTLWSYWFVFTEPTDIMGWEILFEFMVIPFVGHIISFVLGITNLFGKVKWISPVICGIMLMFLYICTVATLNSVDPIICLHRFVYGVINSLTGLAPGALIYFLRTRKKP